MEPEFESLLALGFRILSEGPQQVLLCRTADGSQHYASLLYITEGDHSEEEYLLKELAGKQVTHIIALWQNTTIDVPSWDFRQNLKKLCPDSENALVLLQTGSGQMGIPLSLLQ